MHGSFPGFVAHWLAMTAAMMLPGLVPVVWRRPGRARLVGAYLVAWTVVGVVLHVLYGGVPASGVVVVAAGVFELTPLKRWLRARPHDDVLACVGSCLGLMLVGATGLVAMVATTVVVIVQKCSPPKPAVDVPVALAIVGAGVLLV